MHSFLIGTNRLVNLSHAPTRRLRWVISFEQLPTLRALPGQEVVSIISLPAPLMYLALLLHVLHEEPSLPILLDILHLMLGEQMSVAVEELSSGEFVIAAKSVLDDLLLLQVGEHLL
jgi:hypothetical protein